MPAAAAKQKSAKSLTAEEQEVDDSEPPKYKPSRHSIAGLDFRGNTTKINRSRLKALKLEVNPAHVKQVIKKLGLIIATELGFDHEVRKIFDGSDEELLPAPSNQVGCWFAFSELQFAVKDLVAFDFKSEHKDTGFEGLDAYAEECCYQVLEFFGSAIYDFYERVGRVGTGVELNDRPTDYAVLDFSSNIDGQPKVFGMQRDVVVGLCWTINAPRNELSAHESIPVEQTLVELMDVEWLKLLDVLRHLELHRRVRSKRFLDSLGKLPTAEAAVKADKLIKWMLEKYGMEYGRYWVNASNALTPLILELEEHTHEMLVRRLKDSGAWKEFMTKWDLKRLGVAVRVARGEKVDDDVDEHMYILFLSHWMLVRKLLISDFTSGKRRTKWALGPTWLNDIKSQLWAYFPTIYINFTAYVVRAELEMCFSSILFTLAEFRLAKTEPAPVRESTATMSPEEIAASKVIQRNQHKMTRQRTVGKLKSLGLDTVDVTEADTSLLPLHGFMHALVRLSVLVQQKSPTVPGGLPLPDCLAHLMEAHIRKHSIELREASEVKRVLDSSDLRKFLSANDEALNVTFETWSLANETHKTMTLNEWMRMIDKSGISMGKSAVHGGAVVQVHPWEALTAFVMSQLRHHTIHDHLPDSQATGHTLTFAEFHEALARVAFYKYKLPPFGELQLEVTKVQDLINLLLGSRAAIGKKGDTDQAPPSSAATKGAGPARPASAIAANGAKSAKNGTSAKGPTSPTKATRQPGKASAGAPGAKPAGKAPSPGASVKSKQSRPNSASPSGKPTAAKTAAPGEGG